MDSEILTELYQTKGGTQNEKTIHFVSGMFI
jgi:hypothetical protein